jgi:hypothetical protein
MSNHIDPELDSPTGNGFGALLTPKSTAIAGFAFAVFSMLGQGTWTAAVQSLFWGSNFPESQLPSVLGGWAVASLLLAVIAGLLARRTLTEAGGAAGWEGHLARAAVLVAAAGAVLSALGIIGALLHGLGGV